MANLKEIDWERYFKDQCRTVVAVDPAVTMNSKSNETGIIVACRDKKDRGFVLDDRSGKYSPNQWAEESVHALEKWHAELIVAEKNQGGDLVAATIKNCNPKVKVELVHATKGKLVRAEPIARLYEKGKIYHYRPFNQLEFQMFNFTGRPTDKPDLEVEEIDRIDSPDRLDALVWALSYLFSDKLIQPARGLTPFRISAY